MMYKVPMPTRTNGVRLYTLPNQQIGISYGRGSPQIGPMAYDSKTGLSRDVSFGKGAMEDNVAVSDEIVDKLLELLETMPFFLSMSVPKAVGLTGTFVAPEAVR
jgi:hypothetical protein